MKDFGENIISYRKDILIFTIFRLRLQGKTHKFYKQY